MKIQLFTPLFILLLFSVTYTNAQSALDSTPANCNWNLKNNIFTQISVTPPIPYGKSNASPPYYDVGVISQMVNLIVLLVLMALQ